MAINGTRFTFAAGSTAKDTFAVLSFQLSQTYSELFTLNIVLVSSDPTIGFDQVLDEMAILTIWQGEVIKRRVRGIVTCCEQGDTGKHQTEYRMTVRPYFWRSSHRRNCRSFQNLNIVSIIEPLLREMGINKYDTLLRASHGSREFCVQFMESDYEFISRLTAEEGIFFYEQEYLEANDQKLTFADNCSALLSIGALPYNPNAASETDTYCINNFRRTAQVRPSKVITQDYTFTAPKWRAQYEERPSKMGHQHTVYDIFDYPGRFKDEQHGADFAKYQMEGWRNNADIAIGTTNSPQLSPGACFALRDHPREDLNDNWQVVAINMYGHQPQVQIGNEGQGTTLSTEFEVIPSSQTWRPTPQLKPRVDGPQIAIVTGPPGEEIFCDEHGRVRVKFAWDRYNKADNYSSCWIRVSQAWAGSGFGNIAVPRVGQEVIVDFLNGDPDQPIIIGRTYHATNRAPGGLPGSKTQMAIRSQTYKGSGYNELMFEDATGQELLSMQAQKDMKTKVLNDQMLTVERHRVKTIKGNERSAIKGNRIKIVTGNETNAIKGFQGSTVKVGQSLAVKGDVAQLTGGNLTSLAVKVLTFGSGDLIRLECGDSALELHASGAINLKGKSLNVTIEGNGVINTVGGVLGLNPSSPGSPASAPGEGYKQSIQSSVDEIFNKESE